MISFKYARVRVTNYMSISTFRNINIHRVSEKCLINIVFLNDGQNSSEKYFVKKFRSTKIREIINVNQVA